MEETIRQELERAWGIAVDPMYAGTLRDTGCYRGSQVGDQGHVVLVKDTACLQRFVFFFVYFSFSFLVPFFFVRRLSSILSWIYSTTLYLLSLASQFPHILRI